jgi:hypothetical protein
VTASGPTDPHEAGPALDTWDVVAVAPHWRPAPGANVVEPVAGRLVLFTDRLVFEGGGEPDVILAADVIDAGPLSPGSRLTPDEIAGQWMPKALRRVRCPGFAIRTSAGGWAFDCPHGQKRAREVSGRYA